VRDAPHWVVPPAKRLPAISRRPDQGPDQYPGKFDRTKPPYPSGYLQTYMQSHRDCKKVIITFDKSMFRHRHPLWLYFEEDLGDKVRMTFLADNLAGWPLAPVLWSDRGN